jgi:hypothetical protein
MADIYLLASVWMPAVLLENRLIAFLDVLGFSGRLERDDLIDFHTQYADFIDAAQTATFYGAQGDNTGRTNFEYAQFLFDSIVVVSHPVDDVFSVNHFVGAVTLLLELGFKSGLPLRGAVGLGNFLLDQERGIFLSECFPALVRMEKRQEWAGCVVLSAAEQLVWNSIQGVGELPESGADQKRNQLVHMYGVPVKADPVEGVSTDTGKDRHQRSDWKLALNYLFFLSEKEIVEGIGRLRAPKRANVQSYFEFLKALPHERQILPEEFRPAVYCTLIATRTGMRAQFVDESGEVCEPGVAEFSWVAHGRWK